MAAHLQPLAEETVAMKKEAFAGRVDDETARRDVTGLEVVALKNLRSAGEKVDHPEIVRALGIVGWMIEAQLLDQIMLSRHRVLMLT
jgi:hypothetical protein